MNFGFLAEEDGAAAMLQGLLREATEGAVAGARGALGYAGRGLGGILGGRRGSDAPADIGVSRRNGARNLLSAPIASSSSKKNRVESFELDALPPNLLLKRDEIPGLQVALSPGRGFLGTNHNPWEMGRISDSLLSGALFPESAPLGAPCPPPTTTVFSLLPKLTLTNLNCRGLLKVQFML